MSKVKILITGIAMGYKKSLSKGNDVWKLLFPFNECHSLKFRYSRDGAGSPYVFVAHLAKPGTKVTVSTNLAARSAESDPDFDKYVLDLTSPAKWNTHAKLKMVSGWEDRGALMTIENAKFYVRNYVKDKQTLDPYIKGPGLMKPLGKLAHNVYAEIELGSTGILTVKADNGKPLFESVAGNDTTLWFDNDCEGKEPISNDMDMLYYLAQDGDGSKKQFQIVGPPPKGPNRQRRGVPTIMRRSRNAFPDTGEIPNLVEGKPCMFVKIGDSENLP